MEFIAGFFIVYLLLCFAVASMGETRSIGSGPLFIISILLSPILGFFIALLYPSDDSHRRIEANKRGRSANSHKVCPMCAEEVKMAARICKHCNHQFTDYTVDFDNSNETIDKEYEVVQRCAYCSNESDIDRRWRSWVCPKCYYENRK